MKLPFLKERRFPRVAKPMDEKTINASFEDNLVEHIIGELFDAAMLKDVSRFRSSVEALVLNMFEEATENG